MICDECKKPMPDRYEQFNGVTVPWPICEACQAEHDKKIDEYPKKHGKRK